MKYFKKACRHYKVILALNADKEKQLNFETRINGYSYWKCMLPLS